MEKINVTFKGMSNVPDEQVAQDGQMAMMMNASIKNGEMVVMNGHNDFTVKDNVKKAVFHDGRLLEIDEDGAVRVFVEKDGKPAYEQTEYDEEMSKAFKDVEVENFEIMGNVVVMYGKDKERDIEGTFYAIWKNEGYVYLGEKPDVFGVEIGIKSKMTVFTTDSSYEYHNWPRAVGGFTDECIANLNKDGYYIDRALFRVGLRLFDGSYIAVSNIIYISDDTPKEDVENNNRDNVVGRDGENLSYRPVVDNTESSKYQVLARGFRPIFTINTAGLKAWEDIIVGIDIFSTKSIMGKKVEKNKHYVPSTGETYNYEVYVEKSLDEITEDIANETSFFLIATYNIDGTLFKRLEDVSPSSLAVQNSLTRIGEESFTSMFAKGYNYNSKLHVYGGKEFFFNGYGLNAYIPVCGLAKKEPVSKMLVRVKVYNNGEWVYVDRLFPDAEVGFGAEVGIEDDLIQLPAMLTYPNAKASEMEIFIQKGDTVYNKKFTLKAHPFLNLSYYLNVEDGNLSLEITKVFANASNNAGLDAATAFELFGGLGTFEITYSSSVGDWVYNGSAIPTNWKSYRIFQIPRNVVDGDKMIFELSGTGTGKKDILNIKVDNSWNTGVEFPETIPTPFVESKNILRLSEIDNPFYFPVAQTYQFDGDIVAMASNAEAISQGQFGQFPLFVFTTQGVWAMQVDSTGKTAYSTQTPFSREVCNGAVCALSGGVAFTTDRGVMMITGGRVVNLSQALDAPEAELFEQSESLVEKIFERADKKLTSVKNLRPVSIRQYLKDENGVKLAYNYLENELIVSNKTYGFSYVYDIDTQTWGMDKTGYITCKVDNTGPQGELVMYNGGNVRMIIASENINREIVAITRPMKAGTLTFKRLRQAALRTTFKGALNFYVLGSNDGATFSVITGKEYPSKNGDEPTDVTRRDLITAMSRSRQYKYFAIAIAGNMEGRISMAELLVDEGLAINKLR